MRFYVARRAAHKVRNIAAMHSIGLRELGVIPATTTYGELLEKGAVLRGGKDEPIAESAEVGREYILFEADSGIELLTLLLENLEPSDFILVIPPPPSTTEVVTLHDDMDVSTEEVVNLEGSVEGVVQEDVEGDDNLLVEEQSGGDETEQ